MHIMLLAGCQTIMVSHKTTIMNSVENQIIPYLDSHLMNKPRFQQRSIMIVKFEQNQITSKMDSLTADIRQRIESHLLQQSGIILYRSNVDLADIHEIPQNNLCMKRPELFLGIELKKSGLAYILSLRMLDKQQGNRWVSGFGLSKTVKLNNDELARLKQINPDPWLNGFRESPYTKADIDLLVKDLGQQLKCQLMKQASPESIYIDLDSMPYSGSFKQISTLLKIDLPILTGIPISFKKTSDKDNKQLVLSLNWTVLNKQQGRGRLALTSMQTSHKSLRHISAFAYAKGLKLSEAYRSNSTVTAKPIVNKHRDSVIVNQHHQGSRIIHSENSLPAIILSKDEMYKPLPETSISRERSRTPISENEFIPSVILEGPEDEYFIRF